MESLCASLHPSLVLWQAQAAQFAAVWLWNVGSWTPAGQPLEAHSLTVTQMAFSSTGQHLLTVSRDRTLAVWERLEAGALISLQSDFTPLWRDSDLQHQWKVRTIHSNTR